MIAIAWAIFLAGLMINVAIDPPSEAGSTVALVFFLAGFVALVAFSVFGK